MKSSLPVVAVSLGALLAPGLASAFPIAVPGSEGFTVLVGSTGAIVATYPGNSASFSNDLYLERVAGGGAGLDGDATNDLFIFNNHASPVGSTVDLGTFSAGTELVFRLHVNNTAFDFRTGPAARNPEGRAHARVQGEFLPGETLVSFEDLLNGPFDYNDLSFSFTNTRATPPGPRDVPEPLTTSLVGLGLAALPGRRGRCG